MGFRAPASNTRRERKRVNKQSQKSERFRDSPVTAINAEDDRREGGGGLGGKRPGTKGGGSDRLGNSLSVLKH